MSARSWCAENNINERVYHYWLKKVREYAAQFLPAPTKLEALPIVRERGDKQMVGSYQELAPVQPMAAAPVGWARCQPELPAESASQGITIEIGCARITATMDTDTTLLSKVCRALTQL